jgi:simple sugar transport system substrate-binding protein
MRTLGTCVAAAALAVSALALGAGAAHAQQGARIVVVTHGQASDPFWSVAKNGVDGAAKDYGVTAEYRAPDTFDMVQMGQLIDAAVASQPDGLVISIPDASALGDSIRRAVQAGIPVVSMNSGSDVYKELGLVAHVGQTEFEAGQGGGERMAQAGVKNALCLNQEVGNVALDLRCEGFKKGLGEGASVQVLAVSMDPTATSSAVKAALQKDPSVDGMLALGPTAADPTLQALEETGGLEKVKLGTFDLSPNVLEAIAAGKMLFAIDQQQYLQGYLPVALLALNKRYGVMPTGVVMTGPGFVTKDNAAQVVELSKQGIR